MKRLGAGVLTQAANGSTIELCRFTSFFFSLSQLGNSFLHKTCRSMCPMCLTSRASNGTLGVSFAFRQRSSFWMVRWEEFSSIR